MSIRSIASMICIRAATARCVSSLVCRPTWRSRYTSKTCADCLHVGMRRQDDFSCKNCGQASHADFNAARNIARWGLAV
ncbi:MAG: transposase, partial [Gemmatimonadetes bacterium]|nr:transposase [Gemmatimonadota bacterium]